MNNLLNVTPSPHIRGSDNTQQLMGTVIVALIPTLVASVFIFGLPALLISLTCVVSSVAFEYLFNYLVSKKQTVDDLSAVVTGLLLAFNLPPEISLFTAAFGSFIAIVIVKCIFGGIGQNFANPAITARVVLLLSFTGPMTTWLIPEMNGMSIELVAGATPLALITSSTGIESANSLATMMNGAGGLPSVFDMLNGIRGGCIGEGYSVGLIVGGIYLWYKKVITPVVPLTFIGTVVVLSLLLGNTPVYQILGGGLLIGAIFMATDYTTSPTTTLGKVIFGVGCGIITVIIRFYGSYPEGVSFAILMMNVVNPLINRYCITKPFGVEKPAKQ